MGDAPTDLWRALLAAPEFSERRRILGLRESLVARGRAPSLNLLTWQHRFDSFPLPGVKETARFKRYAEFLESTTSARARDKARHEDETETAADAVAAAAALATAGLGMLEESLTAFDIIIEGVFFGTMYTRDVGRVLLELLMGAAPGNFATTPENEFDAFGRRVISDLPTTPLWKSMQAALEAQIAAVPDLAAAAVDARLTPTLLGIILRSDVTTLSSTDPTSYYPASIALANFCDGTAATEAATGLLAFLPKPRPNPFNNGSAEYKTYRRRSLLAHHACIDVLYSVIAKLRDGFFWELAPGSVDWLVPRVYTRTGDWPEMQKWLALHGSVNSRSPCRFCLLGHADLARARLCASKSLMVVRRLAQAEGAIAPPGAITVAERRERTAARAAADEAGVVAIGRAPGPLTDFALRISANADALLRGTLEHLHVINGVAKALVRAIFELVKSHGNSDALFQRVDKLLPYRSAPSTFRRPSSYVFEKRVEGKRYIDMLLVIHALVEGLCGDEATYAHVTDACFALNRYILQLRQRSFTESDCRSMFAQAVVSVRALRVFPSLTRMIKLHDLLHFPLTIPTGGPPRGISDTDSLEGYMRKIKRLHAVVAGIGRESSMLQRHGASRAITMFVAVIAARRVGGATRNLSGDIPLLTVVARVRPAFTLAASVPSLTHLGGYVDPHFLNHSRVETVTGDGSAGEGGSVRGPQGGNIPGDELYLAALAREILFAMGFQPDPPPTQAARRLWQATIIKASLDTRWHGDIPCRIVDDDFTREGALKTTCLLKICGGVKARRHSNLQFRRADGATVMPALRASATTAITFRTTYPAGDARHAYDQFALGCSVALVSFDPVPTNLGQMLLGPPGPQEPRRIFAVILRPLRHLVAMQATLWDEHPDVEGLAEPWEASPPSAAAGAADAFVLVPSQNIIRVEHIQPGVINPLNGRQRYWRYPTGGTRGTLPRPPFVGPREDGKASVASDDDDDGDDGSGGGAAAEVVEREVGPLTATTTTTTTTSNLTKTKTKATTKI